MFDIFLDFLVAGYDETPNSRPRNRKGNCREILFGTITLLDWNF